MRGKIAVMPEPNRTTARRSYAIIDARRVSRIYEMSFGGGEWRMWRDAPGFHQRFKGALAENGDTIAAGWEKSDDGQRWE